MRCRGYDSFERRDARVQERGVISVNVGRKQQLSETARQRERIQKGPNKQYAAGHHTRPTTPRAVSPT